jgi:hypothetical protein
MPKKDRSKNALKHGAFSRELILPGERRKDYERLLAELEAEYSPSGPSEIYLVHHLGSLLWRQRRLQVYRQAKLEKRVRTIERNNKSSYWMGVLNSLAPQLAAATTAKEVEAILASEHLTPAAITFKIPPSTSIRWRSQSGCTASMRLSAPSTRSRWSVSSFRRVGCMKKLTGRSSVWRRSRAISNLVWLRA